MTIKEALKKYFDIETDLLLSHILGKPREFLFMNPSIKITKKQHNNLTKLIRRREKGEPIAYILGYKDFMGLRLKVNENVLIPRPETEGLVQKIVSSIPEGVVLRPYGAGKYKELSGQKIKILDVGTGSGCIAISIAKELKKFQISNFKFQITASDVSLAALKVAKKNAAIHHTKIQFIHSNILQNIRMSFDLFVANLPYLSSEVLTKEDGWQAWKNNTSQETVGLKFEPQTALFTKEKGLFLIRRLLEQIAVCKQLPKLIFLEFDPRQKFALQKLVKKYLPQGQIKFYKDFNNLWRYLEIKMM